MKLPGNLLVGLCCRAACFERRKPRSSAALPSTDSWAVSKSKWCGKVFLIVGLALVQFLDVAQAQTYQVGDVVPDFTLTNRKTGEPLRLSDYEGQVVFLDFFAYW